LAIVKPLEDPDNLEPYPPVTFRSDHPRIGDRVFAIGSPFGLLNTMSAGIVSGMNRHCQDLITFTNDSRVLYLQTDLHLFPGNSGGPIFDSHGQVVGISTLRSEADGLSFAIQFDHSVHRIVDQMIASGKVRRAWLGFRGVSLNHEIVEQIDNVSKQTELQSIKHGVLVLKAYENSPAVQANLMPGDVIVAINERPIKDIGGLLAVLDEYPIDRPTELNVKRIILVNGGARIISLKCKIKPDEYDIFTHKDTPYN
jgi:S1-C subfamily serine protease